MEFWWLISLQLSIFGFLKEVRPSEPYIYDYLTGKWKNFTDTEVTQEIYPVGTYSYLILLLFVFLFTDLLCYKPLIILLGLSGIAVWSMLLWSYELYEMQILEVFYGVFTATEIAYYTYIYAKVPNEYFQKVSSHTRAAVLIGRALSGLLSQTLTSFDILDYRQLNYISFASVCMATIWAIFLPPVKTSIYFHTETNQHRTFKEKYHTAYKIMLEHFTKAYKNLYTLKWSIWWSLSTCAYLQIENYMQPLYAAIEGDDTVAYNGAVEFILTFGGFLSALLAGYLTMKWFYINELFLAILTIIQSIFILICSQTQSIYVCYILYILYGVIFHFLLTIANTEIAKNISLDSYGLIFGINTFVALIFNSILTFAVVTKDVGFQLVPRDQYVVYGSYLLTIGIIFLLFGIKTLYHKRDIDNTNTVVT